MDRHVQRTKTLTAPEVLDLIRQPSAVPGKYWTNCEEADKDTLYPIIVLGFNPAHRFVGLAAAQPMVSFKVTGEHAETSNPEDGSNLLVNLKDFSLYHDLYLKNLAPAPAPAPTAASSSDDEDTAADTTSAVKGCFLMPTLRERRMSSGKMTDVYEYKCMRFYQPDAPCPERYCTVTQWGSG